MSASRQLLAFHRQLVHLKNLCKAWYGLELEVRRKLLEEESLFVLRKYFDFPLHEFEHLTNP